LAARLVGDPSLIAALGLKQVPHFTTFQKAAQRPLRSALDVTRVPMWMNRDRSWPR